MTSCPCYHYLQGGLQPAGGQGAAPLGGSLVHEHSERVGPEQGQQTGARGGGTPVRDRRMEEEEAETLLRKGRRPTPSFPSPPSPFHLVSRVRLGPEQQAGVEEGGQVRGWGALGAGPSRHVSRPSKEPLSVGLSNPNKQGGAGSLVPQ